MRTKEELKEACAVMLKTIREKHGVSKSKMADSLGVDYHTYLKYENGQSVPSIVDFIEVFQLLHENPLKPVLEYLYPDEYSGTSTTPINVIRENIIDYVAESATPSTVRAWNFLLFGNHGSSATAQTEMLVMLDRLPMQYRCAVGHLIDNLYDVAHSRGELLEGIEPNMQIFKDALTQGGCAAKNNSNAYTTILKDNDK